MTKKEKGTLKNKVVIDSGPLIDYLCNVGVAEKIENDYLKNDDISLIIISPITLTEIFYLLCRQQGEKFASEKLDIIKKSIKVELEFRVREIAGKYKCERVLSLADCYVLATAKLNSAVAVFKKEEELQNELNKKSFDIGLLLIE